MLFIHFAPKANVKRIKRVGLRPGKGEDGVFLRPLLQGEKVLANDWNGPGWWKKGTGKHDNQMAKIVVRIPDDELIRYGDCGDSRLATPITVREYGDLLALWDPKRSPGDIWVAGGMPMLLCRDLRVEECSPTWDGHEVLYDKVIPARWIVNIYDHTNTDARTKRYRRQRQLVKRTYKNTL